MLWCFYSLGSCFNLASLCFQRVQPRLRLCPCHTMVLILDFPWCRSALLRGNVTVVWRVSAERGPGVCVNELHPLTTNDFLYWQTHTESLRPKKSKQPVWRPSVFHYICFNRNVLVLNHRKCSKWDQGVRWITCWMGSPPGSSQGGAGPESSRRGRKRGRGNVRIAGCTKRKYRRLVCI